MCRALTAALLLLAAPLRAQPLLYELDSPDGERSGSFGRAVAGIPDVDGDGRGDLLVGARWEEADGSPSGAGRAYVFSGTTGTLIHALTSPNEEVDGQFGIAVSGVPDLDGDGRGDLLVGAMGEGKNAPTEWDGRAYVFSGATGALIHTLTSTDAEEGGGFGYAVSDVGDLDGDGVSDLFIGAHGEDPGTSPSGAGRAYVFSGATGELHHTLASPNEEPDGLFGISVSGVPDLDGDGVADLLVGAVGEGGGGYWTGRAYVFRGAGGALLYEVVSPSMEAQGQFGWEVSGLPDVDGDGRGDLLVGAPEESPGVSPLWAGRAYVFSGATGSLHHTLASPNEQFNGGFGDAVSDVGDLDADGVPDLLVGAYREYGNAGRAYLIGGASGAHLHTLASPSGSDGEPGYFGTTVSGVPDVNGDGADDLLIGAPLESPPDAPYGVGRAYAFSGVAPLVLSAAALNSPVPRGTRLRFRVTITNNTASPITGDLVLDVIGPDGASYTLRVHDDGTVDAGATETPRYTVPVSSTAPPGPYDATVTALGGGTEVLATAGFTFEVVTGASLAGGDGTGGVLGEIEGLGASPASAIPSAAVVTPNPTRGAAVLAFSLSAPSAVRVSVYDVLGREVAAVNAGVLEAGPHRVSLDLSSLPQGAYVWRLIAGARTEAGRFTMAR